MFLCPDRARNQKSATSCSSASKQIFENVYQLPCKDPCYQSTLCKSTPLFTNDRPSASPKRFIILVYRKSPKDTADHVMSEFHANKLHQIESHVHRRRSLPLEHFAPAKGREYKYHSSPLLPFQPRPTNPLNCLKATHRPIMFPVHPTSSKTELRRSRCSCPRRARPNRYHSCQQQKSKLHVTLFEPIFRSLQRHGFSLRACKLHIPACPAP